LLISSFLTFVVSQKTADFGFSSVACYFNGNSSLLMMGRRIMGKHARRWSVAGLATALLGATALSGPAFAQDRDSLKGLQQFAQAATTAATGAFGGGGFGGGGGRGGGGGGTGRGGGGGGTTTGGGGAASSVTDPGVRGGALGVGGPIAGLTAAELAFFTAAEARFNVIETVSSGLGPGFNELSCGNCHVSPAAGGSSPATNPQVTDGNAMGGQNVIPSFITANGPIREARFVTLPNGQPDGSVHDLFTIAGRSDSPSGCVFPQPPFAAQVAKNNVIFRIPTPLFGAGLIEVVPDQNLQAAFSAQASTNGSLGISGSFNTIGNTQSITRFGWKAQNPSLFFFAGEAYNVEEGVTSEVFPEERNIATGPEVTVPATPQCAPNPEPEDTTFSFDPMSPPSASLESDISSDLVNFAMFPRLLAAPVPAVPFTASSTASTASTGSSTTASSSTTGSTVQVASALPTAAGTTTSTTSTSSSSSATPSAASVQAGFTAFNNVGCSGCHIVSQTTTLASLIDAGPLTAASNITINPFSDFAVHTMGTGLADGVSQGSTTGQQFRTSPLWGVGQRTFFLHDGRTNNLVTAIEQHASSGSEANQVISNFNMLSATDQQNLINFLRDL
jgi:hypothetical protein